MVLLLLLAAVSLILISVHGNRNKSAVDALVVYVDGKEYIRSPLKAGETIRVLQEDGSENVIRMTENGFYMESASCPNQDCIEQGEVTTDNWTRRKLLEQVICLPNRVTVALELEEGFQADPDLPDV